MAKHTSDAQTDRILTLPNVITVARLVIFTPLVIVLLVQPDTRLAATIALVVFSGTDWVDGFVARRTGQVSRVGQWLDPIADRLGVAWICIAMLIFGVLPWWVPLIVVVVDAVILLVGIGRRDRVQAMKVLPIGKARTAVLMVGLPLAALGASTVPYAGVIGTVAEVVLAVGATLHAIVGGQYLHGLLQPPPTPQNSVEQENQQSDAGPV